MNKIVSTLMILVLSVGILAPSIEGHASQPHQPASIVLEPLSQFEYENPWNLITDGRYAFVDSLIDPGAEVMILDTIDPEHIVEIASIHMDGCCNKPLAVTKDILYIGGQTWGGILVYDVSEPANPAWLGVYEPVETMWIQQVIIAGNLAYMVDYSLGLAILDITDPGHPVLLGNNSEEIIWRATVQGQYAYAISPGKLITYDISNPAQPVLLGRYENISRWGEAVAVFGNTAYLSGSQRDDQYQIVGYFTDIIDISNPSQPERIAELPQISGPVKQINVKDGLLYALLWDGLSIYTLGDSHAPQFSGKFTSYWGMQFELQGSQAFLIDNITGVHILDTSDSAQPSQIGFFGWPQTANYLTSLGTDIYTIENATISYPAYDTKSILRVINAADPFNPQVPGYLVLDNDAQGMPFMNGTNLYLPGDRGVIIIDTADPAHMILLARTGNSFAFDIEVLDNIAYSISMDLGSSGGYFTINDVANPLSPTLLSESIYLNPKDMSIAQQGENIYAYLIANGNLVILDVTDPSNPIEVPLNIEQIGYAQIDTETQGSQTIAYVTGWAADMGIIALDVSDPAHPTYLGAYLQNNIFSATFFQARDNLVYFTIENQHELVLVDFSDPSHPFRVMSTVGADVRYASIGEEYLYTTSGWDPVTVFSMHSDLTGRVADHNMHPIAGVTLSLNTGTDMVTGADGAYLFPDLSFGDYVVTPTLGAFVFDPPHREVNIPSEWTSQDFVILPAPVSTTLEPSITTTLTFTDVQGLPTSFIFPGGLISTTATALVTPTLAAGFFGADFAGHAFELAIDTGLPTELYEYFSVPVPVTIQYSLEDTGVITDTSQLALYRSVGTSWVEADISCLPAGAIFTQEPGVFRSAICQEGRYALLGPAYSIALPIATFGSSSQSCEPPGCPPLASTVEE